MSSLAGGMAATSSARRPSGRISGVPQRLHDITVPNSVHFQQVGQQTFMTTAHSHQRPQAGGGPSTDGARTVTGSALIEIPAGIFAQRLVTALRIRTFVALMTRTLGRCDLLAGRRRARRSRVVRKRCGRPASRSGRHRQLHEHPGPPGSDVQRRCLMASRRERSRVDALHICRVHERIAGRGHRVRSDDLVPAHDLRRGTGAVAGEVLVRPPGERRWAIGRSRRGRIRRTGRQATLDLPEANPPAP